MQALTLTFSQDVATILIDNPAKRNALAIADLAAMSAMLDQAAARPGLRALVLAASGDRVFSGGVDLSDVSGDGAWDENPLTALADKLESFPRPTVARISGKVRGGAAELTLACDFRVGARGVDLAVPAARIGIHYEAEGLARAAARLGLQAAKRIYLLAETMDEAALVACGYFDRLAEPAALEEALAALLADIRAGAPLAVDGMKATLAEIGAGRAPEAAARIAACWRSDDLREGLAAVREKRPPVFRGR
ncbi:MAG: enoyl-CoA hydratase/isomerase family protein [Pikeienuella sp.]|uniref:enoyl-CoA hydratase/isomerase family protein n=1 Tax=Pikeienuella sp. TaxID=2831957 RepID=UPI00391B2882